ncbi:MAG: hypothetical protein PHO07_06140 [Pirellulales bacterium]|nr:hypothetical protein [Thermoguttaceae bacterium]MDD4786739.1 hypothetical protein [Pirellulales bacterium]
MGLRERTKFVKRLKARRCPKCGAKLNRRQVRCHRCSEPQRRPRK